MQAINTPFEVAKAGNFHRQRRPIVPKKRGGPFLNNICGHLKTRAQQLQNQGELLTLKTPRERNSECRNGAQTRTYCGKTRGSTSRLMYKRQSSIYITWKQSSQSLTQDDVCVHTRSATSNYLGEQ